MVGVTLQYEMSYTNILDALDLAGIPLRAADQRQEGPFVVCGGPCAFNPEPLAAVCRSAWPWATARRDHPRHHRLPICAWKQTGAAQGRISAHGRENRRGIRAGSCTTIAVQRRRHGGLHSAQGGHPARRRWCFKALVNDLDRRGLSGKDHRALRRGGAQPDHAGDFPGLHPGLPLLPGGHDLPARAGAEHGSSCWNWRTSWWTATGYDEISLMSLSSGDYSCLPELAHEMVEKIQAPAGEDFPAFPCESTRC